MKMAYKQKKITKRLKIFAKDWAKIFVVPFKMGRRTVKGYNIKTGKPIFKKSK